MGKRDVVKLNEIALTISSFAMQAMLYEITCAPSPGLVSPVSNGAHKDMNYFTFIDSTAVFSKYLALFVQEGYSHRCCKEIFKSIRAIGVEAEKDMFTKTKGINTHKGMLFLMGIACAATGKAMYEEKSFYEIHSIIKEMTEGIVDKELLSLNDESKLSHGEKLYLKYKNEGVRGEVERGIPTVFDYSLKLYKENSNLNLNDRLVHTLIEIMVVCNDTTIIHRHNPPILEEVKRKAKNIIDLGGMNTVEGREKINELSIEFIEKNISPGGSADLLAITVFFYLVEEYILTL
ncbi:triphosphoribosyl-dephospho-CoA synthase CitG [Clostridium sp. SHJSY1]|uniref:triphosphoribosyl-dephospho-CoA synthase CitG n=1 Tax=Clostridium sp. SHJSY1 TaxID=2942483 RepID=UPI002875F669|nr:triphosphoribosyl-dephospho-CoA synthase CitG [Clostridium sp. SHJSY1]MDS0525834.1 triphosphoribosyl-dephospho-CoA synthase CitG [Clostridium sp. SHJSY1]